MSSIKHGIQIALLLTTAYLLAPQPASSDTVHNGDVDITGNLCVGSSCADGHLFEGSLEAWSFDPELILFDTSAGANDWEIEANASNLRIKDHPDGGAVTTVVTVSGGAPPHSLVVESSGDIGLGTSTPGQELHLARTSPSIRFEDTDDGQIWDVNGNDIGFRVADITNAITSLWITPGSGDVGFGTPSPLAGTGIHVVKSGFVIPTFESADGNAVQFRLRSNSPNNRRVVGITNTGIVKSQLRLDDDAVILQGQTDANRFALFNAGGLVIEGGTCLKSAGGMACDAVFDPDYRLPTIEEHAASMWANRRLPAVDPTPEGEPVSFNVSRRYFTMLNELEEAHIYIERLNEQVKQQDEQAKQQEAAFETALAAKDRRLAELESRLADTQARLAGITALEQRMARMEALLAARPPADD